LDRKIRVGAVSYLNTLPLLYGIRDSDLMDEIELIIDYPARIADLILQDRIDIGLVPVAIIPQMKEFHIQSNFCIGGDGPVASVCLFSEKPIQEVSEILLDYQSRTSVELVKILLKEYWRIHPVLRDTSEEFADRIHKTTAGLLIGDRALAQRRVSPYAYDLGEAWKNLTGLPFVYAAWISNKRLDKTFLESFDRANAFGVDHLAEVLTGQRSEWVDLNEYFTRFISYPLDNLKIQGLDLFLSKMGFRRKEGLRNR
jgi:chorismate dehydratase